MRAPGRAVRSALTMSSPLPSPRRRSTTAKAGGLPGAAALQEALRDKDAEPHVVGRAGAGREIGLAEPPEEIDREARAVIGDLDGDGCLVPVDRDADLAVRELHRVLNEVVEPVHDFRAAPDLRLVAVRV